MSAIKAKVRDYVAGNTLAARIILADPARYAGLPLVWAQLWMTRKET